MNKQELIDNTVDTWLKVGALVRVKANKQVITVDRITEDNGVSCSNLKAYCRTELEPYGNGWINGYKWGVEYPTNGVKPDLPDDLIVRISKRSQYRVYELSWDRGDWFVIDDERYKPAEPDFIDAELDKMEAIVNKISDINAQVPEPWHDYETQRGINLPPVGTKCEYYDSDYGWQSCTVLMHYLDGVVIDGVEGVRFSIYTFRPLDHATRKADFERKRFVDFVTNLLYTHCCATKGELRDGAEEMFKLGFKLPEDK
jgi:hypothetical protein